MEEIPSLRSFFSIGILFLSCLTGYAQNSKKLLWLAVMCLLESAPVTIPYLSSSLVAIHCSLLMLLIITDELVDNVHIGDYVHIIGTVVTEAIMPDKRMQYNALLAPSHHNSQRRSFVRKSVC